MWSYAFANLVDEMQVADASVPWPGAGAAAVDLRL